MNNYAVTHCHSMLSNGTTNIDSITKVEDYINKAKECDMRAIAFTEHGNVYNWYNKYKLCKSKDIKFIFGIEIYITKSLNEKVRDNYHCCLYAKNNNGINEINKLVSIANNKQDGHFYYVPRITIDEFLQISDNVIIASACLGSILASNDKELKDKYLEYFIKNKDRCFLEIQHHSDESQVKYNKYLYELHKKHNIPLITGTDTHALNKQHLKGRDILQKAKNIHFDNENGWDLSFKTYEELINSYIKQNSLPMDIIKNAIENTIVLSDMIDEYSFDTSYKYPKLYENAEGIFKTKIKEGIKRRKIDNLKDYKDRINYELKTFKHNDAIDFMLLEEDYKSEMRKRGVEYGYSRGSCSGSVICYLLGITEIDSIKHKLNFERFMNTERVSLSDIDTDWYSEDREIVKDYLYSKKGLYCCDIVTFNTIALKGAIRDVGRALEMPLTLVSEICENIEFKEDKYRKEYPELFEYVDLLQGVIVSVGSHPSATVVSPYPVDEWIGTFTTSTSKYPISQLNMKEIDSLNFVKLDILGLDNIGIINQTCKLANIERLTPNNTPSNDINVWKSIRDNTVGIFQWESDSASAYLKQLLSDETVNKIQEVNPDFSYMDLLSIGNGAIRPAGASYRDELANGIFRDNGHQALNDFLKPTLGFLVFQETIIEFLHSFCGYTMGEADIIRRGFAKKTGTEQYIPDIINGFIKTMKEKYNVSKEESEVLVKNFIQVIFDASDYLFSLNHSDPYSWIGYICGYLRYYYPLEFLTTMFNINKDNEEKTKKITEYALINNININPPRFRYSKAEYFFNRDTNTIYKGVSSIKFLNKEIGEKLYNMKNDIIPTFIDFLRINPCNTKQTEILIQLDFFIEFGKSSKLMKIYNLYQLIEGKKQFNKDKLPLSEEIIKKYSKKETDKQYREIDIDSIYNELINTFEDKSLPLKTILKTQNEYLGYIDYKNEKLKDYIFILDIDTKYSPKVKAYDLSNGEIQNYKISKKIYQHSVVSKNDILFVQNFSRQLKRKMDKETGEFVVVDNEFDMWLNSYIIK